MNMNKLIAVVMDSNDECSLIVNGHPDNILYILNEYTDAPTWVQASMVIRSVNGRFELDDDSVNVDYVIEQGTNGQWYCTDMN